MFHLVEKYSKIGSTDMHLRFTFVRLMKIYSRLVWAVQSQHNWNLKYFIVGLRGT